MELRAAERFPATAPRVGAILADPGFYRAAMARGPGGKDLVAGDVQVTGSAAGAFSVAIRRTMAAPALPEQIRAYLPGGLDIRQVNAWDRAGSDGQRRGTVTMDIVGAPVHLRGTIELAPRGEEACELTHLTRLRATVPFVGATIEQAAAPTIRAGLKAERDELFARLAAVTP
jgi:hypothetical protein